MTRLTFDKYNDNVAKFAAPLDPANADRVITDETVALLERFVLMARTIDNLKKATFYGRGVESFPLPVKPLDRHGTSLELLHGVFGLAGESGEVVELALKRLRGESVSDKEFRDELGDTLWFTRHAAHALEEEGGLALVAEENHTKLAERWGDNVGKQDYKS